MVGVLNPTFIRLGNLPYLIVRVDERSLEPCGGNGLGSRTEKSISIASANVEEPGQIEISEVNVPVTYTPDKEPFLPESARRLARRNSNRELLLTYISHLRLARFSNLRPTVIDKPIAFPDDKFSQFGCEDPRATVLSGKIYVTYTAVGRSGATAWLAELNRSGRIVNKTIILGPDHKHAVLFPEKIGDCYFLLSRPLSRSYFESSGGWLFESPDLLHWGAPSPLLMPRTGMWDSVRVGPSTSPIRTPEGWLVFYYGVDTDDSYHVGAALLHIDHPTILLARSTVPVLSPILPWERNGRRADTVFPCGLDSSEGMQSIRLYYGAADTCIGAANLEFSALMNSF